MEYYCCAPVLRCLHRICSCYCRGQVPLLVVKYLGDSGQTIPVEADVHAQNTALLLTPALVAFSNLFSEICGGMVVIADGGAPDALVRSKHAWQHTHTSLR